MSQNVLKIILCLENDNINIFFNNVEYCYIYIFFYNKINVVIILFLSTIKYRKNTYHSITNIFIVEFEN